MNPNGMDWEDVYAGVEAAVLKPLPAHHPNDEDNSCKCGFTPWTLEHVLMACVYDNDGLMGALSAAMDESNRYGFVRGRAFSATQGDDA